MLDAFDLTTHLGAYLYRESRFNSGGAIGFVTLQVLDAYVDAA